MRGVSVLFANSYHEILRRYVIDDEHDGNEDEDEDEYENEYENENRRADST